ncbi:MAG: lipid biosynthesis acyltransferase [Thermomicrobiales bacterium]|nr:lipid biosynthesis acyltransferase [Thermomicrobiales bacterium]
MTTAGRDGESEGNDSRGDRLVLAVLKGLARAAWMIPWPVWRALASVLGFVAMFTRRRHAVLANVRHVRHANPPHPITAWRIGSGQLATHFRVVIGTLRAGYRLPESTNRLLLEGLATVRPYLGQRGIIIVSVHAGPYIMLGLMGRRWLGEQGFAGDLTVVVRMFRPFRSGALMTWFMDYFSRAGINVVSVHESPSTMGSRLARTLQNNGIVVLLVDEPTPTPSANVPFFDSAIVMPLGPVRLARATKSVIVPALASYERHGMMKITLAEPLEPGDSVKEDMHRLAASLEVLIARNLSQWAMLSPIWIDEKPGLAAPEGYSFADLHLHTQGSDGLLHAEEWIDAARDGSIRVMAITDHDHIDTVREWKRRDPDGTRHVIPGVELTARGRIVHLGVLFTGEIPCALPRPGTPLLDLVRWARGIEGSIVVLVHPLPGLWRGQLRRMARAGLLPDAIESRFPFASRRTAAIECAAERYGLAILGGSDAHLAPGQIGEHATLFPGETAEDLIAAVRNRQTRAVTLPRPGRIPRRVYAMQSLYSWLLPVRWVPGVPAVRTRLLRRTRRVAQLAPHPQASAPRTEPPTSTASRAQIGQ